MQFKIRLVVAPGNENVERAAIIKISSLGTEEPDQMILEGETVECTANVLEGEQLILRQLEPPVVHDIDEKMAINMTPEMIKTAAKEKIAAMPKPEPKTHEMSKAPVAHATQSAPTHSNAKK